MIVDAGAVPSGGARAGFVGPGDGDRGAAMVELSVVIGVLLFLILGAVSFGILLAVSHQLNQAAGESARQVALAWDDPGTTEDERVEAARAALVAGGTDCAPDGPVRCEITVEPCAGQPAVDCATVALTHDRSVDPLVGRIPLLESVLPDELQAQATVMVNP